MGMHIIIILPSFYFTVMYLKYILDASLTITDTLTSLILSDYIGFNMSQFSYSNTTNTKL